MTMSYVGDWAWLAPSGAMASPRMDNCLQQLHRFSMIRW
jgi:hypothetical protein